MSTPRRLHRKTPVLLSVFLLAAGLPLATGREERKPIDVYVLGGADVEPLPAEDREARIAEMQTLLGESQRASRELEDELKKEYGKNRRAWPGEARAALEEANRTLEERSRVLAREVLCGANVQKDIDDSVKDLTKALKKKKNLRIVTDPEQAALVIEVLGRASGGADWGVIGSMPVVRTRVTLYVRASLGPALEVPKDAGEILRWHEPWNYRLSVYRVKDTEALSWELAAGDPSNFTWTTAAYAVAAAIDKFIKENRKILSESMLTSPPADASSNATSS
jgi:hypothetical protein